MRETEAIGAKWNHMVTWTENEKPVKQKFLKLTSQVPRCPGARGKKIFHYSMSTAAI